MKFLLINPNTTVAMTERMVDLGRVIAGPTVDVNGVTGRFGARYVASRVSYAVAGHAALDAYAEHGRDVDVVLLGCFGDPALFALRELADVPVVGMAEASCQAAAKRGRFSIVTGGDRWGPMLEEFLASIDLASKLASIKCVAPTGGDIARNPEGSLALLAEACRACVKEDDAEVVVLAGAGLAGLASQIAASVPVPLIDSFEAMLRAGLAATDTEFKKPVSGSFARTPAVETVGLAPALTRALR
jgi:Asp/Glu/hydantoin racemase